MPQYTVESSPTRQEDDSIIMDLVVKPPFEVGEGLADYLYGEVGQVTLRALSHRTEFSHLEVRMRIRPGMLIAETGILLGRLREYVNNETDDPTQLRSLRYRDSVREEAGQLQQT